MTAPATPSARVPDRVAVRRQIVARLLLQHTPQVEIAARLGVSPATVSEDVTALRAAWLEESRADTAALIAQEVATMDADDAWWRARLERADAADDLALAVKIYHHIARIRAERIRLRGLAPAKPDPQRMSELDALLASLDTLPLVEASPYPDSDSLATPESSTRAAIATAESSAPEDVTAPVEDTAPAAATPPPPASPHAAEAPAPLASPQSAIHNPQSAGRPIIVRPLNRSSLKE